MGFTGILLEPCLSNPVYQPLSLCFGSSEAFGPDGVVLWRPEALDCRVLIPPEALELAYP